MYSACTYCTRTAVTIMNFVTARYCRPRLIASWIWNHYTGGYCRSAYKRYSIQCLKVFEVIFTIRDTIYKNCTPVTQQKHILERPDTDRSRAKWRPLHSRKKERKQTQNISTLRLKIYTMYQKEAVEMRPSKKKRKCKSAGILCRTFFFFFNETCQKQKFESKVYCPDHGSHLSKL